jgi:hypothetical protein
MTPKRHISRLICYRVLAHCACRGPRKVARSDGWIQRKADAQAGQVVAFSSFSAFHPAFLNGNWFGIGSAAELVQLPLFA